MIKHSLAATQRAETDPAFEERYFAGLARAEAAGFDPRGLDAICYAHVAAVLAGHDEAAEAARVEAAVAAARARLIARDAEEPTQAEAQPTQADAAQEVLARAVARVNANRGGNRPKDQDARPAPAKRASEGVEGPGDQSPAARVVAKINSTR